MTVWTLIDWRLFGFSALWILGLSLVLAAFSFADYQAAQTQAKVWAKLKEPRYQLILNSGLALFCVGLLGNASVWWKSLLWLILAGVFLFQAWQYRRSLK